MTDTDLREALAAALRTILGNGGSTGPYAWDLDQSDYEPDPDRLATLLIEALPRLTESLATPECPAHGPNCPLHAFDHLPIATESPATPTEPGYVAGHRDGMACGVASAGMGLTECEHVGRIEWGNDPEPPQNTVEHAEWVARHYRHDPALHAESPATPDAGDEG